MEILAGEAAKITYNDRVEFKGKEIVISNFFNWLKQGN